MDELIKQIKINNLDLLADYIDSIIDKPPLRDLFIEVTSRCNAHCEHCGSSCGDKVDTEEISGDLLKKVLLDISNKYNTEDILLNITGGEPLLRKDLFDIMSYAHQLGYKWGMTTKQIWILYLLV